MESLAQLEALCERLYTSQDSAERAHAENTLKCFSANSDYIVQCQYILDNAMNPYALMLASSSLLKQVTDRSLSLQLRLDIRNILFLVVESSVGFYVNQCLDFCQCSSFIYAYIDIHINRYMHRSSYIFGYLLIYMLYFSFHSLVACALCSLYILCGVDVNIVDSMNYTLLLSNSISLDLK